MGDEDIAHGVGMAEVWPPMHMARSMPQASMRARGPAWPSQDDPGSHVHVHVHGPHKMTPVRHKMTPVRHKMTPVRMPGTHLLRFTLCGGQIGGSLISMCLGSSHLFFQPFHVSQVPFMPRLSLHLLFLAASDLRLHVRCSLFESAHASINLQRGRWWQVVACISRLRVRMLRSTCRGAGGGMHLAMPQADQAHARTSSAASAAASTR